VAQKSNFVQDLSNNARHYSKKYQASRGLSAIAELLVIENMLATGLQHVTSSVNRIRTFLQTMTLLIIDEFSVITRKGQHYRHDISPQFQRPLFTDAVGSISPSVRLHESDCCMTGIQSAFAATRSTSKASYHRPLDVNCCNPANNAQSKVSLASPRCSA